MTTDRERKTKKHTGTDMNRAPSVDASAHSARTRQRNGEPPLRAAGRPAITDRGGPDGTARSRVALDPGLLTGANDVEILRCYLDLVRTWRGTKRHAVLRLRQADLTVLVSILGTDSTEIERRLIAATACTPAAARRSRRLLLASLGALTIGLTGVTVASAVTVTRTAPSSANLRQLSPTPRTAVRTSEARPSTNSLDGRDPSTIAPTAVTAALTHPPSPTTTTTPTTGHTAQTVMAAPVPASTGVSPPGTEATVSVPSLGIDLPIIEGGQSVIDEGVVAHYMATGWKEPVAAGAAGTYWLAAHHVTHGGPFAALPDIVVGAEIRVTTTSQTFIYTVTSTEVVGLLPGDVAIYGTDETSPVILLQTCIDSTRRLLVHGILTATL